MANDYITRAKKFVQEIYPLIKNCRNEWDYAESVDEFNALKHRKVIFNHGLTRVALITSDYVVKFDWNQYQVETWGGCEDEISLYEEAEADGFAYLFAKITRYEYNNSRFYIMPRIHGIGRTFDDAWEYMTEREYNWCEDHGVHDLHNHNYGWRDDQICIIDYAAHD